MHGALRAAMLQAEAGRTDRPVCAKRVGYDTLPEP